MSWARTNFTPLAQKKDYIIVGAHAYAISKSSVAGVS